MSARGIYDCTNRGCASYLALVERPLRLLDRGETPPRCSSCRHGLRLVRVRREMPDKVRLMLRERAAQRVAP